MITGLGIGLVGFGLILAYAGVTGQHVKQELTAVFTGQTRPAAAAHPAPLTPGVAAAAAGVAGVTGAPAPAPAASNPLPKNNRTGGAATYGFGVIK